MAKCSMCLRQWHKSETIELDCSHLICQKCGAEKLTTQFKKRSLELKCEVCGRPASAQIKERIIGRESYANMVKEVKGTIQSSQKTERQLGNFECKPCRNVPSYPPWWKSSSSLEQYLPLFLKIGINGGCFIELKVPKRDSLCHFRNY